ncbi:MAG: 50S ribosomal protein L10 [Oscillospiraceae bacterium]|nr:50S ribosomal protein L10 [Oscillospiraceae bacterium]
MPNTRVLEQKKAIVIDLAESMKNAASGVLVDYRGISVEADTKLRVELRKAGVTYKVVKNTLMQRAIQGIGLESLEPVLSGTTALAVSDDAVAPAKILSEYAKKTGDKFKIKAGFVEGRVIDAAGVKALAELPPKEVLIAQIMAGLNAPVSGVANALNANIRGLAVALSAVAEQKQKSA